MIRVVDEFRHINVPDDLQNKLSKLCVISAFAKRLNLDDLAEQAKNAYFNLSSQWDEIANEEAKKQSSNWFLGSRSCAYSSANNWDTDYKLWEEAARNANISLAQETLQLYLKQIKM